MRAAILSFCLASLLCSGCASIICSDHKAVSVISDPPGAAFEIEDRSGIVIVSDRTPATITLKRGDGWFRQGGYLVHFTLDGYEPLIARVEQGVEVGWYIVGNALFAGVIGWGLVDPATGAMWTIEDVDVKLRPQAVVETPGAARRSGIIGYKAHINPATGIMETVPIYRDDK